MARVEPIHYRGKMWCVSVPSGAFVARRNGKVFVTGNSGFPKSLDVSKALDKAAGAEREVVGKWMPTGTAAIKLKGGGHCNAGNRGEVEEIREEVALTAPATPEAQQWQGWGTALKPAWEPIVVARKPLEGTVAANVLKHGTGALNVDGCRVGTEVETWPKSRRYYGPFGRIEGKEGEYQSTPPAPGGRFPANLVLSFPEDEYVLKDDVSPEDLHKLAEWLNENQRKNL